MEGLLSSEVPMRQQFHSLVIGKFIISTSLHADLYLECAIILSTAPSGLVLERKVSVSWALDVTVHNIVSSIFQSLS